MLDMLGIQRTIASFEERNGHDYIQIEEGCWFLYSNGALRENSALCQLREPPDDPVACAKLIVRFHKEKLKRATAKFDQLKHLILQRAEHREVHVDYEGATKELKTLQDSCLTLKSNLEQAERELIKATGITPEIARQRAESEAREAAERTQFIRAIKKVVV